MGDVVGDLNSRRGRINQMEAKGELQVVNAFVPLEKMFGYATSLRSLSSGRGTYTMHFECYERVPKQVFEDVAGRAAGVGG